MTIATKLTTQDYMTLFGISQRTAERWKAQDKAYYNTKRVTVEMVAERHSLTVQGVLHLLWPMNYK